MASGDLINEGLRTGRIAQAIGPPDVVMLDVLAGGPLRIRLQAAPLCHRPARNPEHADLRGKIFGVLSLHQGSSKFIASITEAGGSQPGDSIIVEASG